MNSRILAASAAVVLLAMGSARAETKVDLKGTHLCCGACVKAVAGILKTIDGVTGASDQATGTVSITAKDDATAQKALDALATGGFHGDTGKPKLSQKNDTGVSPGKVKSLTLTDVHNCCGSCNNKIVNTLKSVKGVEGNTAKAKSSTFEVTGDFDAEEVVKALLAAGFHVKVKK